MNNKRPEYCPTFVLDQDNFQYHSGTEMGQCRNANSILQFHYVYFWTTITREQILQFSSKYYQYPSGEHLDPTIISISMESTYSEMQISNYNLIKHKEY